MVHWLKINQQPSHNNPVKCETPAKRCELCGEFVTLLLCVVWQNSPTEHTHRPRELICDMLREPLIDASSSSNGNTVSDPELMSRDRVSRWMGVAAMVIISADQRPFIV